MEEIQKAVRAVDFNIERTVQVSIVYLIQLGTKHGIFHFISKNNPRMEELFELPTARNRKILTEFLKSLRDVRIIEVKEGKVSLNGFTFTFGVTEKTYKDFLPGWVSVFEEIYRMADYSFITPTHPNILLDFDKDADFWDIRMGTDFSSLYRKAIAGIGEIGPGSAVLDLGCGSVSPYELGKMVGYKGIYFGVDYSPSLLEIAKARVEEENLPVELKELDIRLIRPVNEYNTVVMSLVLEYLKPEDYRRVLVRAIEALKPGGSLVIFEPFRDKFEKIEALEFFERLNKDFVRFPYSKEIISTIRNEGFDVRIEGFGKSFLRVQSIP